jgi:glycosyltransferase involved in cell wall biosynthesis
MKISYVNSLCVKNDAISNAVRDEIAWLSATGEHEIRLFAYNCEYSDLPFSRVAESRDVVFNPHFQGSDLVVFHFGVYYPLFNLLPVAPSKAKRLVVFHNVTPRSLVSQEGLDTIDRSIRQISNIQFAHHVSCVSQLNIDSLRTAGVDTPASVMSIAAHSDAESPDSKPSFVDDIIRVLFIGRFVRAKGPTELLTAVGALAARNPSIQMQVVLIGNVSFSDAAVLADTRKIAEDINTDFHGRVSAEIVGDATEAFKRQRLTSADLFVLPTYHEGFCVPILEALASGCKVITYNNSNLPNIAGGFARLCPTGDIPSLSKAIEDAVDEVRSPNWRDNVAGDYVRYSRIAKDYTKLYGVAATRARFLRFMTSIMNVEIHGHANL